MDVRYFLFCTWTDDTVRCAVGLRKVLLIELTFFQLNFYQKQIQKLNAVAKVQKDKVTNLVGEHRAVLVSYCQ